MSQEGLIHVSSVSSIAIDNRVSVSQAKTNMLLSLASEGLMTRFGSGPMGELRCVAGLPYVRRGMGKPEWIEAGLANAQAVDAALAR